MIFVPGRIEILGKHTDYAGGRSLLCATEQGFRFDVRPRRDSVVTLADAVTGATVELEIAADLPSRPGDWSNYARAVLRRVARNFPAARRGANIVFTSDLPRAAGLSSSSALVTGIFLALSTVNELEQRAEYQAAVRTREDLAAYLAAVENGSSFGGLTGDEGVGTRGGSEDHTAMLCCRAGETSVFSFCPVHLEAVVPLPADLLFVVAASGVAAEKSGDARERYNRAAALAAQVLDEWNAAAGGADGSLGDAVRGSADAADWIRRVITSPDLRDRFEHFVEESESLVPAAAAALSALDLDRFGRLVARSQENAERLLRNQVPETIWLARAAVESGAIAASAFGAGFGGSVWALVCTIDAPAFSRRWSDGYRLAFPGASRRAAFFTTRPGSPAAEL